MKKTTMYVIAFLILSALTSATVVVVQYKKNLESEAASRQESLAQQAIINKQKSLQREVASTTSPLSQLLTAIAGREASSTQTTTGSSTKIVASNSTSTAAIPKITLSLADVQKHHSVATCWIVIDGSIYDVTAFTKKHPGGENTILSSCGTDASKMYHSKGASPARDHSAFATKLLPAYFVNKLSAVSSGASAAIVEDVTPPTITITTPPMGATVKGAAVVINATAKDAGGIEGVGFMVDGVPVGADDTTAPYSVTWNSSSVKNGLHKIMANATDKSGNSAFSSIVEVMTLNDKYIAPVAPKVVTVTAADAATHNSQKSCFLIISNKVYDVTPFIFSHPGGAPVILNFCGKESTDAFKTKGTGNNHSAYAYSLLPTYYVGDLAGAVQTTTAAAAASATSTTNGTSNTSTSNTGNTNTTANPPVAVSGATFTAAQVATHSSQSSCYLIISSKVYDVSSFLVFHPGGTAVILTSCGKESTTAFQTKGTGNNHSAYAYSLLPTYYVGDFTTGAGDTVSPVVAISAPAGGSTVSGTVTVSANASDNVGVVGVLFKLDGVVLGAEDMTAPYSVSLNTGGITNGAHTLTAVARDAAGNTSTSPAVSVTSNNANVDTAAPSVPMGISATVISSSQINLSWTASTDNVAVTGYKVYRNGTLVGSPTGTTYSDTGLTGATTYSYTISAVDAVGNASAQSAATQAMTQAAAVVSYTAAQVATHNSQSSCFMTISNKVYDVTTFLAMHPGGIPVMIPYCGIDATVGFQTKAGSGNNHSAYAYSLLPTYYVGDLTVGPADTTAPTVSITAPTTGSTVSGSVTVTATAADNVGVAGVQFKLDGVNLSTEDTTSPYSVAWSTTGSTNGSHALTAIARDAAGNTKTSTTVTVTTNNAVVDTAAPSVPTGLAATVISSNQINLTWTPSTDNIGVTGYRVYRNGTQVGTPATASYSDTGLTGSTLYSYSVSAGDAAGNWSAQTGSVSGTTQVAPIVTFTAAQVATHNTQTNCYMIISAKVYNLTAFLGAHPGGIPVMLPYCGVDGTTAFTTKNRAGGSHSAYAYSLLPTYYIGDFTSGAGDTTAPTVSITVPASNATVSGTVTITASAADNVGVAGVQFRVDGVNVMTEVTSAPYTISWGSTGVANGAHTISAVARDAAGNTGTSANISVTTNNASVDTTAPTVPTGLTGTVISSAQINLSWTASTDNVGVAGYKVYRAGVQVGAPTVTTYSDTGLTAATAYSYTVAAVDAAGNTSAQSTAVSKTTAAVTYTAAQIATYNTQTNCWIIISNKIYSVSSFMSAHPGGTPVIVMYCGKDATTAFTTNGTNMHKHSTTATAMLPSYYVGDLAATPDTTAPTVTLTAPAAGATVTGTVAVSATASDNVGVIGVQFKLDGVNLSTEDLTSPYSISWVSTTATNGTHSLTAVARDAAGNTTTSAARTVTVTNAGGTTDTTAPTVSITAPTTGSTVSGAVTVTATAADNVGVAGVQFKLDGVNLSTEVTTAPYTISWTSSSATNGSHALTAVARDAAGNTTTSGTVTVTVNNVATDTTAPTVSITAPTTGSTVSGAVTVTATAADNVGVAGVQFKLDGVNLSTEVTTAPYTISWVSTTATNGSHALTAVARDAAGNTTTSATVTVTVNNVAGDTTAPTVSITSPANNATVSGTNVSLAATAADNVGVVGVQFKVNGANQGSEDLTSPYSKTWDTTQVANGTYTITAVARDAAGNTTTATAVTVTVNNDTTPPTTPANLTATVISATQINLSWSAATDNVGVTSYRLYRDGVRIVSQSGLTYSDSALTTGTTYSYTIYARDAAGNTSPASTAVTATTL